MKGFLSGIGIRLLIIAVIAGGAFILRDRLSGNAGDLQAGDCFDLPTRANELVKDVQHHPCTEAHTAEVILVKDHPAGAYPDDATFETFVSVECLPAFNAYTGLNFETDTTYGMGYFSPTSDGWSDGDHEVICYAARLDNAVMTNSLRVATQ